MAGTFSQIYIQVVFAVKGRQKQIHSSWEEILHKYICGIALNKSEKIIAINGMPDHIHILFSLRPSSRISDLVREIKKASNIFINEQKFTQSWFEWQEGYGSFSYGYRDLDYVINYIKNQKQHHSIKSFKEEYLNLLKENNIGFDLKYVFD